MNLKMRWGIPAVCLVGTFAIAALAADDASKYKIGTWGNFAKGAVSHTFDDNTGNQTGSGQQAFDQYGFHMTLFTNTQAMTPNWPNLKAAFAKGHEVGSHGVTHPSGAISASELAPSQKTIQQNVPGEKCVTIAYPNCKTPGDQQVLQTYIAGRNCDGSGNPKSPTNWAEISSKMFGTCSGCPNDANSLNSWADGAASNNQWVVSCHHGIGNESHGWAVTSLPAMQTHLKYLNENRSKIWIETFGNVARYIHERDKAKITTKSSTDNSFTITIDAAGLDATIYNYPLCIRRELPTDWSDVKVTQNGKDLKDTTVTDGSTKYIQFDAVPDGSDVVISKEGGTSNKKYSSLSTFKSIPVTLQHASLIIDPSQFNGSTLQVTLFNLQGKELSRYNNNIKGSNVVVPLDKINRSAFLVKVVGGDKTYMKLYLPQL